MGQDRRTSAPSGSASVPPPAVCDGRICHPMGCHLLGCGVPVTEPDHPCPRRCRPSFSTAPTDVGLPTGVRLRRSPECRGPDTGTLAVTSVPARRDAALPSPTRAARVRRLRRRVGRFADRGGRARFAHRSPPLRSGSLPTARKVAPACGGHSFSLQLAPPLDPSASCRMLGAASHQTATTIPMDAPTTMR